MHEYMVESALKFSKFQRGIDKCDFGACRYFGSYSQHFLGGIYKDHARIWKVFQNNSISSTHYQDAASIFNQVETGYARLKKFVPEYQIFQKSITARKQLIRVIPYWLKTAQCRKIAEFSKYKLT